MPIKRKQVIVAYYYYLALSERLVFGRRKKEVESKR